MAQTFSTSVVTNSGPLLPIPALPSGIAEGIIGVRRRPAPVPRPPEPLSLRAPEPASPEPAPMAEDWLQAA